ncbi:MAG: hypothetical protein ACYTGQ_20090 [Planctomycetota bacterium]|jgi:hypothetical protein
MSQDKPLQDREAEDLPTHVVACGERYRTLFRRLNRIERILVGTAAGVIALLVELYIRGPNS